MARGEVTGRKATAGKVITRRNPKDEEDDDDDGGDADAYSVRQFCRRHSISEQLFYARRSEMPDTFSVGSRTLISRESAARWRREREAANRQIPAE